MNARAFVRKGRIVDDTVGLIDYTDRILKAIESGHWHYASDKIGELRSVLDRLQANIDVDLHADELEQIPAEQVWTEAGHQASRHYRLGRLLFRKDGDRRG